MKRAATGILILALLLSLVPTAAKAVETEGKSAVLMELSTGKILLEKNPHEKLPPASVTKIMTMLLIMEAIDGGKISWEDRVTSSETAAAKGGSQVYLKVGETMTVSDMLKAIAVSSANDCACAMAEHLCGSEEAFVEAMNRRAKELGMEDTHFVNCTGLDDSPEARDHRTSAYDIALMSRELMNAHPDVKKYTTIWMDTLRGGSFGLANTNKMVRFYRGATGLKTGFTRAAGFCLSATARREDMDLAAVILGASSSRDRFKSCKSMLDYGFANFAVARPEIPGEQRVPVELGREKDVPVEMENTGGLVIEKTVRDSLQTHVTLESRVPAPVVRGQRLGTLTLSAGEQVLTQVPLVAARDVEKLTWGRIFLSLLGRVSMARKYQPDRGE